MDANELPPLMTLRPKPHGATGANAVMITRVRLIELARTLQSAAQAAQLAVELHDLAHLESARAALGVVAEGGARVGAMRQAADTALATEQQVMKADTSRREWTA